MKREPIYGIMAEFDSATALVEAAKLTHQAGYKKIDAYSPFPIEGLAEEIGFHHDEVPLVVLIGGIIGGLTGYLMQYWMSAVDYPLNIGGKPPHSWPAFIVITFEMTILFAGVSAVFGMLALNGLPMPYHPVFNVPRFAFASKDRFFLIVFSSDKKYDPAGNARFPAKLAAALDFGGAELACCASAKLQSSSRSRSGCIVHLPAVSTCTCSRKQNPLSRSDFFADQRSERPPVEGTVARGQLHEDTYFYTGKAGSSPGDYMPFPVTKEVLERGRERYNIYCAPCHSRLGDGNGFIPSRGFARKPPSYHISAPAESSAGIFLRRDDQRLRHHARLRLADSAAGPLEYRRLHSRLAVKSERDPAGRSRRAGRSHRSRRSSAVNPDRAQRCRWSHPKRLCASEEHK